MIRLGLVSNSSSSSFMLATDKPDKKITLKLELEIDVNLGKYDYLDTKEKLDAHFLDNYCYETLEDLFKDEYDKEFYYEALAAIKKGKIIVAGYASSDEYDCIFNHLMYYGGNFEPKNFEVIQND